MSSTIIEGLNFFLPIIAIFGFFFGIPFGAWLRRKTRQDSVTNSGK